MDMYPGEQIPERLSEASLERHRRKAQREADKFISGPLPVPWIKAAGDLGGKAVLVGLAIWFEAGCSKSDTVKLGGAVLKRFGLKRRTVSRALTSLESAGLISVQRHRGRSPVVTILRRQ